MYFYEMVYLRHKIKDFIKLRIVIRDLVTDELKEIIYESDEFSPQSEIGKDIEEIINNKILDIEEKYKISDWDNSPIIDFEGLSKSDNNWYYLRTALDCYMSYKKTLFD